MLERSIQREVEAIGRLNAVETILEVLRQVTGMRIALVARITPDSWTACSVKDSAGFGLVSGQQLELATTY